MKGKSDGQVFVNMKLVKHIDNKAIVLDAVKAVTKAFTALDAELSSRGVGSGPTPTPSAVRPVSADPPSTQAAEVGGGRGGGVDTETPTSTSGERDTTYDPPDKMPAQGEAKRRFPSGTLPQLFSHSALVAFCLS
jgi:hypothetical protein